MPSFPYQRIVVVGATGCGKSTMAACIAEKLDLEYIELDALYWKPNWVDPTPGEFRDMVDSATRSPGWVLAGNYGIVRDIVWSRAQAIVWLDYPFFMILKRLLIRTWVRWRTKELLWGTNYESFWVHFKLWSKDSLVTWLFQTYWRRKRTYPQFFAMPEYSHLTVVHFMKQEQADSWLQSL